MKPAIGQQAPAFALKDQEGREHTLSDYRGAWVLLYFYPQDDTPGCTLEACTIRDEFPQFQKIQARVLGVSADSVESHKKFAEKYHLPFTLLADEEKKAVEAYGVRGRTSFLINPEGTIVKVYENVKPEGHAAEVLKDLHELQRH